MIELISAGGGDLEGLRGYSFAIDSWGIISLSMPMSLFIIVHPALIRRPMHKQYFSRSQATEETSLLASKRLYQTYAVSV